MPRRRSPSPSTTDPGPTNPCRLTTDRTKRPLPKTIKRLGSTAESCVVTLDCNPVYINRKVDTNVRYARLGLLPDVRDVDLTRVPVPAQEPGQAEVPGGGAQRYTSSNSSRLFAPPQADRPFKRWPDSDPLGIPAAPVQATYPPAYPTPHARATIDTHPGAPPFVQPSKFYGPLREHGRFPQRPYLYQSQTATWSESAPAGDKQAIAPSRHYDARARDARFQPYPRPSPRFVDENERDPSIRRTLAPDVSARHQETGGDALQTRTPEPRDVESHGYNGLPFASPQPDRGAAVQEVVDISHVPTFARQAAHTQSDVHIRADLTHFTPPYKTSHPSEQRVHTRVEDVAYRNLPCLICAYQHKHVRPENLLRCAHLAPTALSVTTTDAPYGSDEAVNWGLGHTFTEPVPTPTPVQPSAIQQQACPAPPADRPTSPRKARWVLAQPDDLHATAYFRLSSAPEIVSQEEQAHAHDTGIFALEQTRLGYSGAELYPQDTRAPHLSASRVHAYMSTALEGGRRAHPAPSRSAQTPYQGAALHAQSMIVHDGSVMARPPMSFTLGHALPASPLYKQGCDSTGSLDDYSAQEAHPSAHNSSLRTFRQGPLLGRPIGSQLLQAINVSHYHPNP